MRRFLSHRRKIIVNQHVGHARGGQLLHELGDLVRRDAAFLHEQLELFGGGRLEVGGGRGLDFGLGLLREALGCDACLREL